MSFATLPYTKEFHERKHERARALLAFLLDLENMLKKCGVCKVEAVQILASLLVHGAKKVYVTNTANEMKADTHVYRGDWPVIINALIQRFSIKNVLKEAHFSVAWAFHQPNKNELEF